MEAIVCIYTQETKFLNNNYREVHPELTPLQEIQVTSIREFYIVLLKQHVEISLQLPEKRVLDLNGTFICTSQTEIRNVGGATLV